ncbi:unnamed protein product [Allacma fusca]|uniref:Chitin-binding type-2 domain-containing protein n=1 Tax=Allacma fusca TaxID=39272 RepID=A0A8J2PE60_9HEXA|nr:unnamed protein product [Allacma fusca]
MESLRILIIAFLGAFVIISVQAEHRPKYRCVNCHSKKLFRRPFATITRGHRGSKDKVKLNLRFFDQAKCEEEGNYAHPLGDCHKYLRCHRQHNRPKMLECRPGRTFDPFTRSCEDELDARDCKACNKPQGYKIPHEKGGAKFYMCQDGAAYEFACNNDVIFNKHTRACGNSESHVDPRDVDDRYVPGSVSIHIGRNGKRRKATGIKFNKRVSKPIAKNHKYHTI